MSFLKDYLHLEPRILLELEDAYTRDVDAFNRSVQALKDDQIFGVYSWLEDIVVESGTLTCGCFYAWYEGKYEYGDNLGNHTNMPRSMFRAREKFIVDKKADLVTPLEQILCAVRPSEYRCPRKEESIARREYVLELCEKVISNHQTSA